MVIESLGLYYHIECFRCFVCNIPLSSSFEGTDVRVRNHRLHCQNCFSDENGKLVMFFIRSRKQQHLEISSRRLEIQCKKSTFALFMPLLFESDCFVLSCCRYSLNAYLHNTVHVLIWKSRTAKTNDRFFPEQKTPFPARVCIDWNLYSFFSGTFLIVSTTVWRLDEVGYFLLFSLRDLWDMHMVFFFRMFALTVRWNENAHYRVRLLNVCLSLSFRYKIKRSLIPNTIPSLNSIKCNQIMLTSFQTSTNIPHRKTINNVVVVVFFFSSMLNHRWTWSCVINSMSMKRCRLVLFFSSSSLYSFFLSIFSFILPLHSHLKKKRRTVCLFHTLLLLLRLKLLDWLMLFLVSFLPLSLSLPSSLFTFFFYIQNKNQPHSFSDLFVRFSCFISLSGERNKSYIYI